MSKDFLVVYVPFLLFVLEKQRAKTRWCPMVTMLFFLSCTALIVKTTILVIVTILIILSVMFEFAKDFIGKSDDKSSDHC